ncbi:hypothetical protein QCA50_006372 [Cerrena zonata]|uniref:Uncharacterized protein n=1 Tax=Cerrena zonata TaxID=2478898 RepID=A0AAW0GHM8_9APHY
MDGSLVSLPALDALPEDPNSTAEKELQDLIERTRDPLCELNFWPTSIGIDEEDAA